MSIARIGAAASLATLLSSAVSAQEAPSAPPTIKYGETVEGQLTMSSDTLADGSYYMDYVLSGTMNDSVTVFLASTDFNVALLLADSVDHVVNSDDNGGGACNAYLTYILPQTGRYVVYVNSSSPHEIGRYQLAVQRGFQPPPGTKRCAGFLNPKGIVAVGDSIHGLLDSTSRVLPDTSYYEVWTLAPAPGKTITINLQSKDFDSRLILVKGFAQVLKVDDDGGGGCNARIVDTQADQSPRRVVVVSRGARAAGAYDLTVTEGEEPIVDTPKCTPPGKDRDGA